MKNIPIFAVLTFLLTACAQLVAPLAPDTPAPTDMPPATNTPQPIEPRSAEPRPTQLPGSLESSTDLTKDRVPAEESLPGGLPKEDSAAIDNPRDASIVQVPFDFEIKLYQGQETLGDTRVNFSDAFDGKPVVVVLWAGLCPTCRRELPLMQEAYKEYGDRITFVGIDIGPFTGLGFEPDGRALLQQLEISFPAGGPPDGAFMREYRILGTPASIFFSAGGEVVNQWSGLIPAKQLRSNLEELLDS